MNDTRQRFHFADQPVRGEVAHLAEALQPVFEGHAYPPVVRRLLGELLVASVLLTATLKLRGRLSLQARGNGPIRTLLAECTHNHTIRGIAHLSEEHTLDNVVAEASPSPQALLGEGGLLVITLEPEQGQRYQGIVPLEGDTVAACLEAYFAQSEQLPTRLWLAASESEAGGLLLQMLPRIAGEEEDADLWPRLSQLADTVRRDELLQLPAQELLYRLYHEEDVVLPPVDQVQFACTCSRERTAQALIAVGQAEVEDIVMEQGEVRLHCDFCHTDYVFSASEARALFTHH